MSKRNIFATMVALAFALTARCADFALDLSESGELPAASALLATQPIAVGDTIAVTLPGGAGFDFKIVSAPPAGIAGQSFIAQDANSAASAIVKQTVKGLRIVIDDFPNARQFTIRLRDGKATVTERDVSQEAPEHCGTCAGDIASMPDTSATVFGAGDSLSSMSSMETMRRLAATSDANDFTMAEKIAVVDILVAYDRGAKAWIEGGGCSDAEELVEFAGWAVDRMNMVLEKSQLDHLFCYRLVGVTEVDAMYTNVTNEALINLRTGSGPFSHIPALRDAYGADTVTLLVDVDESASSYSTGVGFSLTGADANELASNSIDFNDDNRNCNVCHVRRVWNRYTMSHETGHNMGCGHSNRQGDNSGPQSTSYSCGYHFLDANNVPRHTIMAYNYSADAWYGYEAIPYFSSPDITPEEYGVPVGTEEKNNNRKVLTLTYNLASQWREHVVPYDWDVRFLDSSGNDIGNGLIFEDSVSLVLSSKNTYPDSARVYITLDGSTPNTSSLPYRLNSTITLRDTTTLTACIVTNGVAESMRSVKVIKGTSPVSGVVWQTDGNYPWSSVSDADWTNGTKTVLHNYDYSYNSGADKISYLSAFIEGPKRLYFRHKSNFASQSEGRGRWGRFSVLCEDGDVFSTTESSMTWRQDHIDIPSGNHRVTILYSQGNAHYSSSGVWLDDLQLVDNQTDVAISPRDVSSFVGSFPVTLTADRENQTIYYTTDGTAPTAASTRYTGPITVSNDCTIKAIAIDANGKKSAVFVSNYRQKNKGNVNMSTMLGDESIVWSGSQQNEWGSSMSTYVFNYKFTDGAFHNYTWLGTIVEGPKTMSFTYKTAFINGSSMSVTIDGETAMTDSEGSTTDITRSVAIPAGTHDVRFVYSQNYLGKTTGSTHGLFLRSVSFIGSEPLTWSGEAGENGNGRWMDDSSVLAWNDSTKAFDNILKPTVTFADVTGNASPVVTVKGAVSPGNVAFTATTSAYTFAKGDDDAFISIPDSNFSPPNSVTFNTPVKMDSTSFYVADGKTYTFNAPFGQSATASCATNSNVIIVGAASTLNVSPGAGNTQVFNQFNNSGTFWSSSKFNVGEGTVVFTGNGNWRGLFGSLQITAKDNGKLVFEGSDSLADNAKTSVVNVENGGGIEIQGMVNFQRKLNFKGGYLTVAGDNESYGRAFEFYNAPAISVSANSSFNSSNAKTAKPFVYFREGSPVFTFTNNAMLTNSVIYADGTANFANANGGITLNGEGTFIQNSFAGEPLTYVGATKVGGGMTLELNAEHRNAGTYTVDSGARLSGRGVISGDGAVTLDGSGAKLCGSLSVKNLICANNSQFGDPWNPVSATVTGSLATKTSGASVIVTNGYLTVGSGCDVSGFATANLTINGAGIRLCKSLTVANLYVNKSTVALLNGASLVQTGSRSLDCSKIRLVLDGSHEPGAPILVVPGGIVNWQNMQVEGLGVGRELAYDSSTNSLYAKAVTGQRLPTVDVLVGYDIGAQEYVANKGKTLEEFAVEQIEKMNAALATNKLDECYSYRLAGVCKVDARYSQISSTLDLLTTGTDACVTLRAHRELYGADTVTLLTATSGTTIGDSIPLSFSTDVASCHECAFSVCSISAVDTGKQHTMLHENAHNMGCGHSRAQSIINSPFEYGRGYYFADGAGTTRHTIMAYGGDSDASWYFSTSSILFGLKLGDADNDNARVLRETCDPVAEWRSAIRPYADEAIITVDGTGEEVRSGRVFATNIAVRLSSPIEGATIYYNLNGYDITMANLEDSWEYTEAYPVLRITADKVLSVALRPQGADYLLPVRKVKFYRRDAFGSKEGVVWHTSEKYPWASVDSGVRSFNQTEYSNQCTTPLKATVTGAELQRLSFEYKSYFGGESVAGNNYSHFDVLLDDSPVLVQTECTNEWLEASIDIPAGEHEIMFVFSQRFAMNNPSDYKDGKPKADDAVWLRNIELGIINPVLEIPAGTSVKLEDIPSYITTIIGEGTLECGATLPDTKYGFTASEWKGTVAFENLAEDTSTQNFQFELYGNALSRILLDNCTINYLKNNNATFAGVLEIAGTFATSNGYSDNYNAFGALEGSGSMSFTTPQRQAYVFNTASNYTGSITITAANNNGLVGGRRIVVGEVASISDVQSDNESASVLVKPGAVTAIGAGAKWETYNGVAVGGTLLVKGAGAELKATATSPAFGVRFDDGAELVFDSADAALTCSSKAFVTNGTVVVKLGDGVVPAARALVTWPGDSSITGAFRLEGIATNDYELAVASTGLSLVAKPTDRIDLSGYSYLTEDKVEEWLDDNNFGLYSGTWKEFMDERSSSNGYTYLQNYILGFDADWDSRKFEAKISFDAEGNIVIETTEGTMPSGLGIVKWIYHCEALGLPWTKERMSGTTHEFEKGGAGGFYKVEVGFE